MSNETIDQILSSSKASLQNEYTSIIQNLRDELTKYKTTTIEKSKIQDP
jgi:hypothetical protein